MRRGKHEKAPSKFRQVLKGVVLTILGLIIAVYGYLLLTR